MNRHDDHIRAFCLSVDEPIAGEVLAAWLEVLMSFVGSNILRVKGILNIEGSEQPIVVHGVQRLFPPPVPLPARPDEDRRSRLVCITRKIGQDVIEGTLRVFQQVLPQAREDAA